MAAICHVMSLLDVVRFAPILLYPTALSSLLSLQNFLSLEASLWHVVWLKMVFEMDDMRFVYKRFIC